MAEEYYFNFKGKCVPTHNGEYVDLIFKKQAEEYGESGAEAVKKQVTKIFDESKKLNNEEHKNILLIGKVQSGKTSNLEMFTALAFDNDYKCVIIYGGYDSKLLAQTVKRFQDDFQINYSKEKNQSNVPALFSTDSESILNLNESIIKKCAQKNKPIIIISMKNYKALGKINSILQHLNNNNLKTFIIDDEGDQASLNTEYKKNKQSATYNQITKMIKTLNHPLYLSVTATPQANVLLGKYSELKPQKLFLIEPGNNYTGSEFFHLDDSHIIFINNDDVNQLDNGEIPDSLRNAINYFIIASVFLKKRGINDSQMIIHTDSKNIKHKSVYSFVFSYVNELSEKPQNICELSNVYNLEYFPSELLKTPFEELKNDINNVIKDTNVVLQNSQDVSSQTNAEWYSHNIYVGGNLLQRGLTFKHLICTYFTRWPKSQGNMDTIGQRARWFGYRSNYLDLCKIFTTQNIHAEYAALAVSERDLWDQCSKIQDGLLDIDDIIIDSTGSSLKPTRSNVADWDKVKFHTKWNNQKYGIFNQQKVDKNNEFVKNFLSKFKFIPSTVGRSNNCQLPTCTYSIISKDEALNLIKSMDLFLMEPFDNFLEKTIQKNDSKIIIEKMFDDNSKPRIRTFNSETNKILALQQGADTPDKLLQKYQGDANVIVDPNAVIFQIFKVTPQFEKGHPLQEDTQYMFSVYFPLSHQGYKRKENV